MSMMSVPKIEFDDEDMDDPVAATLDLLDDKSLVSVSTTDEYMISDSSDNIIAYRIVHMPDDAKEQVYQSASTSILPAVSQNVQYIVIDSSNGMVQTVPTPQVTSSSQITSTAAATTATKVDAATSKLPRSRASIAIAPKATAIKANASGFLNCLRKRDEKRDDRRRATHNEVERRRRDKINHWIMKLGSIIPADGKIREIGNSGRLSIAAIEGQSKGGILSKAFEYVQALQTKQTADGTSNGNTETTAINSAALDKKKYEDEIARLRGENELLKAILMKHGINYVKERHMFRPNDYS